MTSFNLIQTDTHQNKTFFLDGNGKIAKKPLKFGKYYTSQEVKTANLREFHAKLLAVLAVDNAPYYSILRGSWLSDDDIDWLDEVRLCRIAEAGKAGRDPKKGDLDALSRIGAKGKPERLRRGDILEDTPRQWVCFDFDKVLVGSLGPFDVKNPTPWVDRLVESELGPEFVVADKIIHLSSSAGLSDEVSAHVWFWLSAPMDGAAWRAWYASRVKALGRKPYIDKTLFEKERIHYIAPPVFKGSAVDPCEGVDRIIFSEGLEDCVYLSGLGDYLNASAVAAELRAARGVQITDGEVEEAHDAWSRPGIVGAFNRVYSMSETIERFLSEHYRIDTEEGRVTWLTSESGAAGGCKIFANNTKMFSSHGNCPFDNEPRNAFELITHWLFNGDERHALRWAETIPEVVAERDRVELDVFGDLEPSEGFVAEVVLESDEVVVGEVEVTTPETMMRDYPMPKTWGGLVARYSLSTDGDWFYGFEKPADDEGDLEENNNTKKKPKKKKSNVGAFVPLWSPISVLSEEVCAVSGDQTVRFKIRGVEDKPIEVSVPRQDIEPNKLVPALKRKGWRVGPMKHIDFCNYVNMRGMRDAVYVMPKRGWNPPPVGVDSSSLGFATLSGEVLGSDVWGTSYPCVLRPSKILKSDLASKGTLEGWKNGVKEILKIDNVHHWVLGSVVGFAGPLVEILDCPTSGFAICGNTSRGKTTMMCIAASVWGTPGERAGGLFKTLNSTQNAVESIALDANGTVLILDETNTTEGKSLEPLIYKLATGVSKLRLDVNSESKGSFRWSTFGLISGELGVSEKYEESTNKKMGKGAALRFLDMDISVFNRAVEMNVIRNFKSIFDQNYGIAGPKFVANLISEGFHIDPSPLVKLRNDYAAKICGGSIGGVHGRGAEVLSLVWLAAYLADKWSIIPEGTLKSVEKSLDEMWAQFINGAVANNDEKILQDIRMWIAARCNNTIVPIGSSERSSGVREGWYDENFVYLPSHFLMAAAGGTTRAKEIVRLLASQGILNMNGPGRPAHYYIPGAGRIAHYRLIRSGQNGVLPISEISENNIDF